MAKLRFLRTCLGREFTYFRSCCANCWYFDESQNYCEHQEVYKSPGAAPCSDFC